MSRFLQDLEAEESLGCSVRPECSEGATKGPVASKSRSNQE